MKQFVGNKIFRSGGLIALDIFFTNLIVFISLFVRFGLENSVIPVQYFNNAVSMAPLLTVCSVLTFYRFRLYNNLWKYASLREAMMIFLACTLISAEYYGLSVIFNKSLPRSCYVLFFVLLVLRTEGERFAYRFLLLISEQSQNWPDENETRILVIGAGAAGNTIIREMNMSSHPSRVVCAIDDSKAKQGTYINGVPVVGGSEKLLDCVEKYKVDEIIFAIPFASKSVQKNYMELCKNTTCTLKTLPSVYQLINGEVSLSSIRKVDIADLLGRDQVKLNLEGICDYIAGRTVLVTGAGGSIGSELCRQLVKFSPARLILLDIYENSVYYIQQELTRQDSDVEITVLVGSVRDEIRMEQIFATYRPDIVYHAAAHKHVPLMEESPNEAVKNNVFGTLNTVRMSDKYGVSRFVMISTDKAVNPTNIMGATKRICEMIIQTYNNRSKTEYVAVRFGNVLGSNGSVIPIFRKQIEEGGPVTVTHPEVIRYFMTIPEAVSLVLEAGALAKGGEIFVLDMGEPVKILTLAENMIRLSGYVPYKDINIVFTGLRPGEKIYEEMLMGEEGLSNTENQKIHIGKPLDIDEQVFSSQLVDLKQAVYNENSNIRAEVKKIVSTYNLQKDEAGRLTIKDVRPKQMAVNESPLPI